MKYESGILFSWYLEVLQEVHISNDCINYLQPLTYENSAKFLKFNVIADRYQVANFQERDCVSGRRDAWFIDCCSSN